MSLASKRAGDRVAALIRHLVSEHGSQAAVARLTGLSPAYVGKLVRDEGAGGVRAATLSAIARALDLPETFFTEDEAEVADYQDARVPTDAASAAAQARKDAELFYRQLEAEAAAADAFHSGRAGFVPRVREIAKAILDSPAVFAARMVADARTDDEAASVGRVLTHNLRDPRTNFTGHTPPSVTVTRGSDETDE